MVGLDREPLNSFDENAIKILNTRANQVSHIERSVATVLAPLIDSCLIFVEGIYYNIKVLSPKKGIFHLCERSHIPFSSNFDGSN